jgi:hypothetical protein
MSCTLAENETKFEDGEGMKPWKNNTVKEGRSRDRAGES